MTDRAKYKTFTEWLEDFKRRNGLDFTPEPEPEEEAKPVPPPPPKPWNETDREEP